jgi:tetratricopeptide (TPR) repeat protein
MAAMAAGRKWVGRDLPRAIAGFDRAVAIDPDCAQAYLYRAGLKLLARDQAGALADFRALSGLDHSFLPAYRDLTTLSAEEFPELIAACERAVKAAPKCAWAHVFKAFSLRSLMRYEQAIEDLDRAVACEPKSAALLAMRSRVKLTNRQGYYDGVGDMRRAVALAPHWGWLRCWLGEALRHDGSFKDALASLDKGVALDDQYLRGFAWRGGVKVALKDYRGAIEDLTRSLSWHPIYSYDFEYTADQKSWALNQRMLAWRGLGKLKEALADLNRAHRFGARYGWLYNPERKPALYEAAARELAGSRLPWARAWRGWVFLEAERFDEAVEELSAALRASPGLAWPRAWKGRALFYLGDRKGALACFDRALALDPDYAPAWGWRGEARRAAGELTGAISDFTKAVKLDHRASWALAGRGECRQKQGDLRASIADLDRALGINPDYAQALGWRAETRRLLKDFRGALADADRALALRPGLVLTYVTRSLIKGQTGDLKGQVEDFKAAARLDPSLAS